MQDLSYDFRDPVWEFNGVRFAVQLFTYENVYGLDPDATSFAESGPTCSLQCTQLTSAGGQMKAEGQVLLKAVSEEQGTSFSIQARMDESIRCVKLLIKGVPAGEIVNLRETARKAIPETGLILGYPKGWRELHTPLVILQTREGTYSYFESLDAQVRAKRFVFLPQDDKLDVELIFDQTATRTRGAIELPAWVVGSCDDPGPIVRRHRNHVEQAYRLVAWDHRTDVPDWAREISLIAAIHCQHWTGYVFNDYAKVLETIEWLAGHIPANRILAYLPGWEGRYYWQYGDYRPDPRMGGEQGFERLINGAKSIGARVMPMFGINVVNQGAPNYARWGAPAGHPPAGGKVDWDGSRLYHSGWSSVLNPGAPTWQNRLVAQIVGLIDRYGFDGVFLDISAGWWNDPNHDVYEGTVQLIRRIREEHPEILIAGEGWYDAMGAVTPLVQSGHMDGPMVWHDQPYPSLFEPYARCFAHLCLGDPGRGSTGVHELGHNSATRSPLRRGVIPTVAIVEDTLAKAPDDVLAIIDDAKRYVERFLSQPGE